MSAILTEVLIIAVLLMLNGVFAMSELAIVAAKRVRLERQAEGGNAGARAALTIAANPGEFLSTVQVGITLVGVIASAYAGATIAEQLAGRLGTVTWIGDHAEAVALGLVVAGVTYASVIVGELVPKRIALAYPERVASIIARPMGLLARAGAPLVHLLTGSTQLILRLFGVRGVPEPGLSEEEIQAVLEQGAEAGVVPEAEHAIVENVFRLGDRQASAVMTARPDVEWVDLSATKAEILDALKDGRDWVLVCDGDIDHVLGSAHASDLLVRELEGQAIELRATVREAIFIPATTPVLQLLESFRKSRKDVAVMLDEYGGVAGVATRDNVVAVLLGDSDSTIDAPGIVEEIPGVWLADGHADIRDVEELLDLPRLDSQERRGDRTLGGFMLSRIGRVPAVGEVVRIPGVEFKVFAMDGRRIARVVIDRRQTR